MQREAQGKYQGVTFTVKATQRHTLRERIFREKLGLDGQQDEFNAVQRAQADFCYVASHVVAIDGVEWQPPDDNASKKALQDSYEQYLDTFMQPLITLIMATANKCYMPTAGAVEKPDAALTEGEAADPN